MKVPSFSDFGKTAKEVLYGGSKGGSYQYDKKVKLSAKASDGMAFTLNSTVKGDKISGEFKTSYGFERYTVDVTATNATKVTVKGNIADFLTPGLKCTASCALPASSPPKVGVQYVRPYLNSKLDVDVTTAPKVSASLASGYSSVLCGGDCSYDTAQGTLSSWTFGAGWVGPSYETAFLLNNSGTAKILHAQHLDNLSCLGLEIVRPSKEDKPATFCFGYSKSLSNGALIKAKADSTGLTSLLWENQIDKGVKMGVSGQFDIKDLDKGAKVGTSFEIN